MNIIMFWLMGVIVLVGLVLLYVCHSEKFEKIVDCYFSVAFFVTGVMIIYSIVEMI